MHLLSLLLALPLPASGHAPATEPLQVLTTTPELRDLAQIVGGDAVEATSLLRGPEDPHFAQARPSSIKAANRADLFVKNGMSLEIGYEPLIVSESRNPKIQPGSAGHLDASAAIRRLDVPAGAIDRSMGDVHPDGNPHYLLDPMNGKVVARSLRDALAALAPAQRKDFEERCARCEKSIDVAMFGEKVLERFSADTLAELLSQRKLGDFLRERGALDDLGGWAARMLPLAGTPIVTYHKNLAYFAARYGLDVVEALEPKPGVQPSSTHLETVIATMKARNVRGVFSCSYQPSKPVEKVCAETGAKAVVFPHQVDASASASGFLSLHETLVKLVSSALQQP